MSNGKRFYFWWRRRRREISRIADQANGCARAQTELDEEYLGHSGKDRNIIERTRYTQLHSEAANERPDLGIL